MVISIQEQQTVFGITEQKLLSPKLVSSLTNIKRALLSPRLYGFSSVTDITWTADEKQQAYFKQISELDGAFLDPHILGLVVISLVPGLGFTALYDGNSQEIISLNVAALTQAAKVVELKPNGTTAHTKIRDINAYRNQKDTPDIVTVATRTNEVFLGFVQAFLSP